MTLYIVASVVWLAVVAVIMAPSLASSSWARRLILKKVSTELNGTVTAADWSLGWITPITVNQLIVKDSAGHEIFAADSVQTELTLLSAIRSNFDLGNVVIDGVRVNLVRHASGETNLQQIIKSEPATTAKPSAEPGRLPDVRGTITLRNINGVVHDEATNQSASFDLSGEIKIPGINDPITNNLQLTTRLNDAPAGVMNISGTARIAKDNLLNIDLSQLQQNLQFDNLDAASLALLLPADSGITHLAGIFQGQLQLQGQSAAATASGTIKARNFAISTPALQGDTFISSALLINLPTTQLTLPSPDQPLDQARIRLGDSNQSEQALTIQLDQGTVRLTADTTLAALTRLAANDTPASTGHLAADATFDLGALAQQLPNLLHLNQDLTNLTGQLDLNTRLNLEPTQAKPTVQLSIQNVTALNTRTQQRVQLDPVKLDMAALTLGGKGPLPDLRDIKISLTSGFATADIAGSDLGSINGAIHGTYDALQRQLSQFVDFGAVQLAGGFDIRLNTNGDLTSPGGTSAARVTVNLTDLTITGLHDLPPIQKQRLQFGFAGQLRRGQTGQAPLQSIENLDLTLQAGQQDQPWLDVNLVSDAVELLPDTQLQLPFKLVRFDLRKMNLDLVTASQQVSALAQILKQRQIDLNRGSVTLAAAGSLDRDLLTLSNFDFSTHQLDVMQKRQPITDNLNLSFNLAGQIGLHQDAVTVDLSRLNLTEPRNFIALKKTSGGTLNFALPASGGFSGRGQVQLALSLPFISSMAVALQNSPDELNALTRVRRGFLDLTIDLNQSQPQAPTDVSLAANIRNLLLGTTASQTLDLQDVSLNAAASIAADQSLLKLSKIDLTSIFGKVNLSDTAVDLKAINPQQMLRSATFAVDLPDLGRLWSIYQTLVPAAGQAPDALATANADLPTLSPLRVDSGQLQLSGQVQTQNDTTTINISKLTTTGLTLARGQSTKTLAPLSVTLAATLVGDNRQPLQFVRIQQLDTDLGLLQLQITEPLQLADLSTPAPLASGTLTGQGDLQRVLDLANFLTGSTEAPAYSGLFTFTQKLATRDHQTHLDGQLLLRDLKPTAPNSTAVNDELQLTNTITIDLPAQSINIQKFDLLMPRTQALGLSLAGTINHFESTRDLNLNAQIKTDWERLWQLIYPLLDARQKRELADAKFFGLDQRNWEISGTYPAGQPLHEAIRGLKLTGGIGIKTAQAMGWDVRELDAPFEMTDGHLKFLFAKQQPGQPYRPNAQVNTGIANFANIVVDLTDAAGPRVSTPDNYKLVVNATLNPVLAEKFFSKLLMGFNDAKEAQGKASITIAYCQNLLLKQFTTAADISTSPSQPAQPAPSPDTFSQWQEQQKTAQVNSTSANQGDAQGTSTSIDLGRAKILVSLSELRLGSPTLDKLGLKAVDARIDNAQITIENGVTNSLVPMAVRPSGSKQFTTMTFDGAVRFSDSQILNMNLAYPTELLPKAIREMLGDKALGKMQNNIMVPISGSLNNPQFDLLEAAKNSLLGANPLDQLFKKLDKKSDEKKTSDPSNQTNPPSKPQSSVQSQENQPADPLSELLNIFTQPPPEKQSDQTPKPSR